MLAKEGDSTTIQSRTTIRSRLTLGVGSKAVFQKQGGGVFGLRRVVQGLHIQVWYWLVVRPEKPGTAASPILVHFLQESGSLPI